QNRFLHAHPLAGKAKPLLVQIHDDDPRAGQLGELDGRQTDRAGPDDQHRFIRLGVGAVDRVQADAERFHEGELLEREFRGDVQFAGGDGEERAESAIDMHAERLVILAAVGIAARARIAGLTIDVGFDGGAVAGANVADALADGHDLDAEFVAGYARVAIERHFAEIAGVIRPADADAVDANDGVPGARARRLRNIDETKLLWLLELNGTHG